MKKMMVLSLVFSVMALGTAMANDANAMVDRKPKNVHVCINVPPMGICIGNDRPCPPPPPHNTCYHKNGKRHHNAHHDCYDHKPHHGKHGKPHGNHYSKPHGKPGGAPAGRPGGAHGGRPGGNHNGAHGRR